MRESGNTNITYEYILDTVHDKNLLEVAPGDQTVTYDELIYSWRDHNESKEYLTIDTAYSHYIIDTFSACTGKCNNNECLSSNKTCTEICDSNYDKIKTEIDEEINSLILDLSALYDSTMGDYIALQRRAIQLSITCITSLDTANALADIIASRFNQENTELVDINNMRSERQTLKFAKMDASGNDHVIIENFVYQLIIIPV